MLITQLLAVIDMRCLSQIRHYISLFSGSQDIEVQEVGYCEDVVETQSKLYGSVCACVGRTRYVSNQDYTNLLISYIVVSPEWSRL